MKEAERQEFRYITAALRDTVASVEPMRSQIRNTHVKLYKLCRAYAITEQALDAMKTDNRFEYECYASTFTHYWRECIATCVGDFMAEYSALPIEKRSGPDSLVFRACNDAYFYLKNYDRANDERNIDNSEE